MAPNLGGNLHGFLTLGENSSRDDKMTDYYPLIAHAVEELGSSTGEARRALYARARNAVAQLRSNPALSEADIAKECGALEEAIRKVEAERQASHERKHGRSRSRRLHRGAAPMAVRKLLPSRRDGSVPIHSDVLPTAREQLLSGDLRGKKAVKGSRDVAGDVPDLGATTAKAAQPARQGRQL